MKSFSFKLALIALALLCALDASAQVTTNKSKRYGKYWVLNYQTGDKGARWCSVDGGWNRGTYFSFVAYQNGSVIAMLSDQKWNIPEGQLPPISVTFDKATSRIIPLIRANQQLLVFDSRQNAALMRDIIRLFASANSMTITFPNGEVLNGDLAGTHDAISGWESCISEWDGWALNILDRADAPIPRTTPAPSSNPTEAPKSATASPATPPKAEDAEGSGTGIALSTDGIFVRLLAVSSG